MTPPLFLNTKHAVLLKNCVEAPVFEAVSFFLSGDFSPHTRAAYLFNLMEFFQFSHELLQRKIAHCAEITERLVLLWKKSFGGLSGASVARKLSALSSFLTFAQKRKLVEHCVVQFVPKPKEKGMGKYDVLTQAEVICLLEYAERQFVQSVLRRGRFYAVWRLRYAVLFTLLTVGLRVQELCLLKMNSLEQVGEHWRLHVVAKGNEQHSPLIHKVTAQVLQDYKEEFRSGARLQDPLFVRVQKTAVPTLLNRSSVFDMVKVVVKESGVLKHLSPHACRATVATLLHGQGVPIMHIQQLLNHKHITTTSLYVKKADELGEAATQKIQFLDSV